MTDPDADPVLAALEQKLTEVEANCHQATIAMLHRQVQFAVAAELLRRAGARLADLGDESELLPEIGAFLAEGGT